MHQNTIRDLLTCQTQGAFLIKLRNTLPKGRRRQQDVADKISPLVNQAYTKQWVSNLENDRAPLNSAGQLAFVRVFGLNEKLAVRLQLLAGQAAGCLSPEPAARLAS